LDLAESGLAEMNEEQLVDLCDGLVLQFVEKLDGICENERKTRSLVGNGSDANGKFLLVETVFSKV
jgi:hypothetical protein